MTFFKDGRTVSKLVAFSKMERDLDEVRRLLNNVSSDRMLESENSPTGNASQRIIEVK